MKLSLALAYAVFYCCPSFPAPTHAFLLTNLASRSLKHPTPSQQKGLYSRVEYEARGPLLDEYGLPLDPSDLVEKPTVPFKDRFYDVVDKTTELVESFRGGRREQDARRIVHQRRSIAKAMAIKDKVIVSLDYVTHPGKAWKTFVADPISARQKRQNAIRAEKRAKLERSLQRYYAAKNRFYETIDAIESTSRKTFKVAKGVGSAVVGAPATVQRTVKSVKSHVQDTTEAVAKVASGVSTIVSKIGSVIKKDGPNAVGGSGGEARKGKKDGKEGRVEGEADPMKVREIWETKQQTAVRTIWQEDELVKKPAISVTSAPVPAPTADARGPATMATATDAPTAAVAAAPANPTSVTTPTDTRLSVSQDVGEKRCSTNQRSSGSMGEGLSFRQRVDAEEKARSRR
ncbi:choline dehydrogenase [Nannochloropsis oceanica]